MHEVLCCMFRMRPVHEDTQEATGEFMKKNTAKVDSRLITAWEKRIKLRAEGDKLLAEGNKLWAEGDKLYAEGDKLYAEGSKLYAEGSKLYAEGYKLYAEGYKLYAEGYELWAETILAVHGNIALEWNKGTCTLATGEVLKP